MISLDLVGCTSVDDVLAAVGDWARTHPDEPWIVGAGYSPTLLPGGLGDATWLDQVCADRPVALTSNDHHMMWVNTVALTAARIDAQSPQPEAGVIARRSDHAPLGTMLEWGAIDLIRDVMPAEDAELTRRGMAAALTELARHGIVWAQDAVIVAETAEVYRLAAHGDELTCRFNLALRAEPGRWVNQRDEFVGIRTLVQGDEVARRSVEARTVKFFADGVIEGGTGFLLEPYADNPHSCGLPNWQAAELAEAVRWFDAAGFQIHIHAIGDGGVRMSLDAIEHAITQNGPADRRPVIAHTQLVHPADRPRFAALGVIANFEPLWCTLDPTMIELTIPRLGDTRSALQYPIATIASHGARISFGSDWPVSSVNPLAGLANAVTRTNTHGQPVGGWTPHERIPMLDAVHAYTAGTAYQAYDDHQRGTLAVGSIADIAILDTDITTIDGYDLTNVTVDHTLLAGRTVYRQS